MTNNVLGFDINGVKVFKDSNTELKRLFIPTTGSTTCLSLLDAKTNTTYQVPAGKKCTIIYIISEVVTGGSQDLIYSDTADEPPTNSVLLLDSVGIAQYGNNSLFISAEVPALKYIGLDSNNAARS